MHGPSSATASWRPTSASGSPRTTKPLSSSTPWPHRSPWPSWPSHRPHGSLSRLLADGDRGGPLRPALLPLRQGTPAGVQQPHHPSGYHRLVLSDPPLDPQDPAGPSQSGALSGRTAPLRRCRQHRRYLYGGLLRGRLPPDNQRTQYLPAQRGDL